MNYARKCLRYPMLAGPSVPLLLQKAKNCILKKQESITPLFPMRHQSTRSTI